MPFMYVGQSRASRQLASFWGGQTGRSRWTTELQIEVENAGETPAPGRVRACERGAGHPSRQLSELHAVRPLHTTFRRQVLERVIDIHQAPGARIDSKSATYPVAPKLARARSGYKDWCDGRRVRRTIPQPGAFWPLTAPATKRGSDQSSVNAINSVCYSS
jgi:hypothetical protein